MMPASSPRTFASASRRCSRSRPSPARTPVIERVQGDVLRLSYLEVDDGR